MTNIGSFTEGNQPKDRKPRGKGKKVLMIDAIRSTCGDEKEFLERVVKAAMGDPLADPVILPNAQLLTLVLQRIEAPLKSTAPLIEFDFPENGTPTEKALSIVESISDGILPMDIGQGLIGIIKDSVIIEEGTDLKKRIEKIEEMINK